MNGAEVVANDTPPESTTRASRTNVPANKIVKSKNQKVDWSTSADCKGLPIAPSGAYADPLFAARRRREITAVLSAAGPPFASSIATRGCESQTANCVHCGCRAKATLATVRAVTVMDCERSVSSGPEDEEALPSAAGYGTIGAK